MANQSPIIWPEHDWQTALAEASEHGDERPTWGYQWPAGERLAQWLNELFSSNPAALPQRILDLGCGRGLLGMSCLSLNEHCSVTFADASSEVLDFVSATARANNWHQRSQTLQHRWGEALPPCDMIVGGDILYRPELHQEICDSIASSSAPLAIISDPRQNIEPELPQQANNAGLNFRQKYDEKRRCSWVILHPTTTALPQWVCNGLV